jgi:hypothetical protein
VKKNMIILLFLLLWASPAAAQLAAEAQTPESLEEFNARLSAGYSNVSLDRNPRAGEYEYLKSSLGGALDLEWTPLPQRFSLESYYLNQKDYFGEMNYAYRDVVLFNMYTRGMYHNLDHYTFGPDDPTTPSPSFVDLNPNDQYAVENQLKRAFIRFKTPDFPLHLYADVTTLERNGTIQQRFMRGFTGGLDLVSQSRDIDWNTREVRMGVNSHLGPVEFDYNHAEKKFESRGSDRVLYDNYTLFTVPHNLVPDLKSSSDTVRVHTSLTGRLVAGATYSVGEKKNEDSGAKANFHNAAGDLTLTPVAGLVLALKYRHYDLSVNNPDTVTLTGLGATFNVRDSISSKRDVIFGTIRYRLTERMTAKAEYTVDTIERDETGTGPNNWAVAHRTLKSTEKIGITYRVMSKLSLRADYRAAQITNPAYAADPDRVNEAKATATWTPIKRIIALASYGGVREKRDNLAAPLAGGSRKSNRDQALGSITFLVGDSTSITASFLYLKNKTSETISFTDAAGMFNLENGVPYGDKAEAFSLSASQAIGEGITLSADANKIYSKGNFRLDGSVPNTTGIDTFSDLNVVEDIYTVGLEMQFGKRMSSDLRYQQRRYDDKIDNTQDGRVNILLATMAVKW